MEDYRLKIENLPTKKLQDLADRYRKTIAHLEAQQKDARFVAIQTVLEYTERELTKKRQDLIEIEQLLLDRKD
ncbi:MAG: hypothetical protein WCS37_12465 [Chloroflexota bacterium]|nr:hypothetical protein [Chloroflexota bacterium]